MVSDIYFAEFLMVTGFSSRSKGEEFLITLSMTVTVTTESAVVHKSTLSILRNEISIQFTHSNNMNRFCSTEYNLHLNSIGRCYRISSIRR